MLHSFKIVPLDDIGHFDVYMDGVKQENVEGVLISLNVDEIPHVALNYQANNVEINIPAGETQFIKTYVKGKEDH